MLQPLYKVRVLPKARAEMNRLHDFIAFECFQRKTADKYLRGIQSKIDKLAWLGDKIGVNPSKYLQRQYGPGARTIFYKKMSIIYTVSEGLVIVHSVRSGNTIK